ncbi:PREDICTED: uncharacterized protein LOC104598245 [Nelumbo nucifera]|uniref:Uncharacterized protein LOC104598245 n=2 Tax=Nelumbo nucifera TaxID=4432 RepID=A0A1U8A933_NELNU|nr:PREDICTED: uncharacterized protein LOC104598245 [Nelumbo nucifera]XP_010258499.1 PREDICTED: uncharacterized protein LOC104598245 [Nelumbo nucifera]XP_010258500.1 PREDICTED: uncharacterized protein LOC104598245 [Nelumbo nucifera]XP_019053479.1 PREDICTED: uncharacterized protein LOC104598245 [Nelumbo nucifera]DAD43424.1 TPA_asm: hypothetical protein HUJ06_001654 [Nelumbo nucifera]
MDYTKCTRVVAFFVLTILATNFMEIRAYAPEEPLYERHYTEREIGLRHWYSSEAGRKLLQSEIGSAPKRQRDDGTVRVDPLDHFKKYRGGYDITNKHYWSSTVFTGVYGYAIGIIWFLCGMIYGGFLLATNLCCTKKRKLKRRQACSKQCYLWPILLGTIFTFLAIIASGVVLGGTSRFHSRAKTVINIIMDTADEASRTLYNTTEAMRDIRDNLKSSEEVRKASGFLNSTSRRLDYQAADIERQARKNRRLINRGLKIVYATTTVAISLNLVAVVALSVSVYLKLPRAFHLLIIVCWILTVLCWVGFGIYFFLERFTGDTCTAFEDFQQDPSNSTLGSILPCDELVSAKSVLQDVSKGIYNLVNQVNANISELKASTFPNIAYICNPFSAPPDYNYQPENCPLNTIKIGDIPQVLKAFTCSGNTGTCTGELISDADFKTVEAYTSSIQNLLNSFPGMESLVDCQLVKDAFSEILSRHCHPMKKYVRMVWASMVVLSTIMVALVLTWMTKLHHDQKRHFNEGSSVKPHSARASMMDFDATEVDAYNELEPKSMP